MALVKIKYLDYVKNTLMLNKLYCFKCYNNKYLLFITLFVTLFVTFVNLIEQLFKNLIHNHYLFHY
jgi:hypothetical protein